MLKERKEKLLVLLLIIIAVSAFALNLNLGANDELWDFSNAYKMKEGYVIYKDLNVIITPLFFYIIEVIFKFLGSNYLIFRICNIIIFTIFYMTIYLIYNTLEIKGKRGIFYLILTYILTYGLISGGANYNILALDLYLIGILCILKNKPNWMQGVFIFLIFMTKQNIGVYYAIGYVVYEWIKNKKIKETIKAVFPAGMIAMILMGIYVIYLWTNQSLYDFINYAFLGIAEFGTKNLAANLSVYQIGLAIMSYPIMIWIITSPKLNFSKKHKIYAIPLICFSIVSLLIAYPLMNEYHVNMSIVVTLISFIFIIEKSFLEDLTANTKIEKIMSITNGICIILIIGFNLWVNTNYYKNMKRYNYHDIYYGAVIDEEMKKDIDTMVEYIRKTESEEKQIKILSYYSNLYMNILGKNNGKMDLPFYGNLGKEGEDGLIQEISRLENANVLILKEEDVVYQESKKVREYIMNTYEQIGEIGKFFIYKVGY